MRKRMLIITIHALYGLVLGYFFMFSLMHLASIKMRSDVDLSNAIQIGVCVWPVLVALAAWTGNELYKNGLRISKAGKNGYMLISFFTGAVIADFALSISFSVFKWDTGMSTNLVLLLNGITWGAFAVLVAWVMSNMFKRIRS